MTDQWPRYEVFKQDRPGGPHRNVGSVHAPDAELALMNARDVFARRPACYNLWVVPATAITTYNVEQPPPPDAPSGPVQHYVVCAKQSQKQTMTYVDYLGSVPARSAVEALRMTMATFDGQTAGVWWVFPEGAVTSSDPEETAGFEAATGKLFRLPNQYHTVFTMSKIRRGEGESE
jgi:ring-1,2-phenylacetyl-CoA epoxidase subunit PaaB